MERVTYARLELATHHRCPLLLARMNAAHHQNPPSEAVHQWTIHWQSIPENQKVCRRQP